MVLEFALEVSLKLTSNEPQILDEANPAIGDGFIFMVCVMEAEHPKFETAVKVTE